MSIKDEDMQGIDRALDEVEKCIRIGEMSLINASVDNLKHEVRELFAKYGSVS